MLLRVLLLLSFFKVIKRVFMPQLWRHFFQIVCLFYCCECNISETQNLKLTSSIAGMLCFCLFPKVTCLYSSLIVDWMLGYGLKKVIFSKYFKSLLDEL